MITNTNCVHENFYIFLVDCIRRWEQCTSLVVCPYTHFTLRLIIIIVVVWAFWCFCVNTEQHSVVICRFVTFSSKMEKEGFFAKFWFSSLFPVSHITNHFGTQFNEVFGCFYLQQFIIALDHGMFFLSLLFYLFARKRKNFKYYYKEDGKMLTFNWISVVYQRESNISTEFCCVMDPTIILCFGIGRLLCILLDIWRLFLVIWRKQFHLDPILDG